MNMAGLPMPRGTWLILVVSVIPMLVSHVASAAPGYPVEDPSGASYVVAYDSSDATLTVTSPKPSSSVSSDNAVATDTVGDASPLLEEPAADAVASGVVAGPNGQINHGQVVKQLHELTDGRDSGCITSAVARSDLGKGDDQSTADDIDAQLLNVDCAKKNGADASDAAPGKSDAASGKSDAASGKSGR